jgi:pyrroloquinoline quinone biosynthesis protein B
VRIHVLGAAAGGGLPQWNCGCSNCRKARAGDAHVAPRTQESVAVSADGKQWFLLNASPEIRSQIESFPPLHPAGLRHSPIAGIVLTNGDLDHCLGLLCLRESYPLVIYASESVRRGFSEGNVLYRTLERFEGQTTWRTLVPGEEREIADGLSITAILVPGKPPVHLEGAGPPAPDENIGVVLRANGARLAYFPSAAGITAAMRSALDAADCVFFDGTFWSADELVAGGFGTKNADDMAHLPVGGERGSLATLARGRARRRLYIHLNNTNPLVCDDSPEHRQVEAQGWEVARDGMEIVL